MTTLLDALHPCLLPGRRIVEVAEGIHSVSAEPGGGAPYDGKARAYDRLVRSRLYHRVMWGSRRDDYADFTDRALARGSGPFLDVGCGTLTFTAEPYARASRPLVLLDQSVDMLQRGRERLDALGALGDHVLLLQGDALDLPFRPGAFEAVMCMGIWHLFDDAAALVRGVLDVVAPSGRLFVTSLVTGSAIGNRYLGLLHRAGEVATPRSAEDLRGVLDLLAPSRADLVRRGAAAFATVDGAA